MTRGRNRNRLLRHGITLLELMLALALTVLVLMAVGMAVNMNLRSLTRRSAEVEESQLARAVFRMITDDLRSAVQYQKIDFSEAQKMAEGLAKATSDAAQAISSATGGASNNSNNKSGTASGTATGGGAATGTGQRSGGASTGSNAAGQGSSRTGSGSSGSDMEEKPTASISSPPSNPGLYGTQYELQVDVSRLPRLDEYSGLAMTDPNSQFDVPSDMKSVTYFVKGGAPEVDVNSTPLASSQHVSTGNGLARRSMSRLTAKWAMDNGNIESLENSGEIIAPEVTNLEFRYFDGTEWTSEWNSDDRNAFPMAVEVLLAIKPIQEPKPNEPQQLLYRLVIKLPVGKPSTLDTTTTATDPAAAESGGATSGSTSSSSSAAGS